MNPLLSLFSGAAGGQSGNVLAALLSGTSVSGTAAGLFGNAGTPSAGQVPGVPFNVVLQGVTAAQGNGLGLAKAANIVSGLKPATFKQPVTSPESRGQSGGENGGLMLLSDIAGTTPHAGALVSQLLEPNAGESNVSVIAQATEAADPAIIAMALPVAQQPADTATQTNGGSAATSAISDKFLMGQLPTGEPDSGQLVQPNGVQNGGKTADSSGKPQTDMTAQTASPQAPRQNAGAVADAVQATLTAGMTGAAVAKAAGGKAFALGHANGHPDGNVTTPASPAAAGEATVQGEKRSGPGLEGADPRHAAVQGKNNNAASSGHGGGYEGGAKSQNNNAQAGQSGTVTKDGAAAASQNSAQAKTAQDKPAPMFAPGLTATDLPVDPAFSSSLDMQAVPAQSFASSVSRHAMAPALTLSTATHAAAQVAVHIQQAVRSGQSDFHIRLDPPELGRIDVKLEFGEDGRVTAVLATDNERTLQMFERHQGLLERALQDAGLKTDSGSLNFTLKQENQQQSRADSQRHMPNDSKESPIATPQAAATLVMSDRALDIRV